MRSLSYNLNAFLPIRLVVLFASIRFFGVGIVTLAQENVLDRLRIIQTTVETRSDSQSEATTTNSVASDQRNLLLSDFRPIPSLNTQLSDIRHASYSVVDVHSHFRLRLRHDLDALVGFIQVMDRNNIAVCASLDATLGPAMQQHMDYLWQDYRDRFVIFANIDFRGTGAIDQPATWDCNQPDFIHRIVDQLNGAALQGISGLKIFKSFGLNDRNADGSLISIDDERWSPIWDTCGRLGLPVIMHTADPSAFFKPIDANNERYEELSRHPDWAFPPDRFPTREALHAARDRVYLRHPKTIFIAAHMGNDGEDLQQSAQLLDAHPNLYLEIASRISELGRQPFSARRFLEKYADRIMFGTDGPWPEARLISYWRFLETEDEYFPYSEKTPPPQGLWNIYGVRLPASVLQKIYHENAAKIIPGVAERLEKWETLRGL